MNEQIYKTMSRVGGGNIAIGIIILVTGIVAGILLIVSGAKSLKRRYEILI